MANPYKVKTKTQKERDVKIEFIKKITAVIAAGFGLVVALAWNDAIQSLFKLIPLQSTEVWAKFFYAFLVTGAVVLFVFYFNRASEFGIHEINLAKKRAAERAKERAKEKAKKERVKAKRRKK